MRTVKALGTFGVLAMLAFLVLALAGCDATGPEGVAGTYDVTADAPAMDLHFEGVAQIDSVVGGAVYGYWVVDGYQTYMQDAWKIGVTSGNGQEVALTALGYYTRFFASHETVREGDRLRCVDYTISFALDENVDGTCSISKW